MKKWLVPAVILLLGIFLGAGYLLNNLTPAESTLRIPVTNVPAGVTLSPAPISSVQAYREKREQTRDEDLKTLQGILDSGAGNAAFLADVAAQLSQITRQREEELAIEGVLIGSGFSPCLAVVAPGSVTVIVTRETLTRGEAALIMTLCEKNTQEALDNIKIMTGDML